MEALLLASVGFQVASGLSSSISESSAIKSQGEFQAGQFEFQARLAELQAKSAETRGRDESDEALTKAKLLIGRQRAKLAAQGIEIDSGSALDIQLETAELGAVDSLTIRNNAFREASGYRIQAIDFRNRAAFSRIAASTGARNTLLTGGLTAASDLTRGFAALDT